jgi:hypothetical protein
MTPVPCPDPVGTGNTICYKNYTLQMACQHYNMYLALGGAPGACGAPGVTPVVPLEPAPTATEVACPTNETPVRMCFTGRSLTVPCVTQSIYLGAGGKFGSCP